MLRCIDILLPCLPGFLPKRMQNVDDIRKLRYVNYPILSLMLDSNLPDTRSDRWHRFPVGGWVPIHVKPDPTDNRRLAWRLPGSHEALRGSGHRIGCPSCRNYMFRRIFIQVKIYRAFNTLERYVDFRGRQERRVCVMGWVTIDMIWTRCLCNILIL